MDIKLLMYLRPRFCIHITFLSSSNFADTQDAGISLRNNAWIFEHAKANREGAEFLKQEIAYLSKNHQYQWIPYAIAESVFKFAGFWLGLHGINPRRTTTGVAPTINNA